MLHLLEDPLRAWYSLVSRFLRPTPTSCAAVATDPGHARFRAFDGGLVAYGIRDLHKQMGMTARKRYLGGVRRPRVLREIQHCMVFWYVRQPGTHRRRAVPIRVLLRVKCHVRADRAAFPRLGGRANVRMSRLRGGDARTCRGSARHGLGVGVGVGVCGWALFTCDVFLVEALAVTVMDMRCRAVVHRLTDNPRVYFIGAVLLEATFSLVAVALTGAALYVATGKDYAVCGLLHECPTFALPLVLGEGFLTDTLITEFAAYRYEWVAIFYDVRWLQSLRSR